MDQDSCHRVLHPCGHHAGADPSPHPFLSVPYEAPPRAPDCAGALAAGLHLCPLPAGACAAAPHHADVLHIQLHLQVWKCVSQDQEEELTHHYCLPNSQIKRHISTFLNIPFICDIH